VGTFSGLSAQLVDKSLGLVNVGPEYFELEVSPPHARSILAEADELLREFVGALVDTFEESSKKKASFDN